MKKTLLLLVLLLTACAAPKPTAPSTPGTADREGNPITLPARAERIVTMGPSNTEIVVSLGLADKIIAVDTFSTDLSGVPEQTPAFDMMQPDTERLVALAPDLVLVTGMSKVGGFDMYKTLADSGVCVAFIPTPNTIEGIKQDIQFIGMAAGAEQSAREIITQLEAELEQYSALGSAAEHKQKVYFELSAAPAMYSFGRGVFLDEMITLLGAENIFADQDSWISVSDEAVLERDPDVIFTNVDYIDDPVGEIKSRAGWENVAAVRQGRVYSISTNPSSVPDQYITIAMKEMASALYD